MSVCAETSDYKVSQKIFTWIFGSIGLHCPSEKTAPGLGVSRRERRELSEEMFDSGIL